MSKVFRRSLNAYIIFGVSALFIIPPIIAAILFFGKTETEKLLLLAIPFAVGCLILLSGFLEYKRTLTVTDKSISFAYRVNEPSAKSLRKRVLTVNFDDILHVQKINLNGNGLLLKDTFVYYFYLKDKTDFKTYFYPFGRKAEKQITQILEEKTDFGIA